MNWFLNWLERRGRVLTLREKDGTVYLKRYYILFKEKTNQYEEEKSHYPFNLYLHHFFRSDLDDLHDHPWWFATLILKSGYYEEIPDFIRSVNINESLSDIKLASSTEIVNSSDKENLAKLQRDKEEQLALEIGRSHV